ncbi:MAG: hypothetical protein K2L21_01030 [Muribaculaceae bacterium]|nr:hypothetical protein [Muribaculaceae bacterium]
MTESTKKYKDFLGMEAVQYVAFRYGTTPDKVVERYLVQSGLIEEANADEDTFVLTPNEIALFHDLGISPHR